MKRKVRERTPSTAPRINTSASADSTFRAPSSADDGARAPSPTVEERTTTSERPVMTSFAALGAHLFWIFIGPAVMALLLISIVLRRTVDVSTVDIAYVLVASAVLACRWIDQRTGQATTGTGERSTWTDFRRYAIRLPPTAIGIWGGAKLMAFFLS